MSEVVEIKRLLREQNQIISQNFIDFDKKIDRMYSLINEALPKMILEATHGEAPKPPSPQLSFSDQKRGTTEVPGPTQVVGEGAAQPIEKAKVALGSWSELLEFNEDAKTVYVKACQYFHEKSTFVGINNIVKSLGGRWVSMGKDSRWEIPK